MFKQIPNPDKSQSGKLKTTSRTSLTVAEMNVTPTNNVKGNVQARKDGKYPTNGKKGSPVAGKDDSCGYASPALSMSAQEQDKYLQSGELAFPKNEAMYDYLKRDSGSDESGDLDKGFDSLEVMPDAKNNYSDKNYDRKPVTEFQEDYKPKRFGK